MREDAATGRNSLDRVDCSATLIAGFDAGHVLKTA